MSAYMQISPEIMKWAAMQAGVDINTLLSDMSEKKQQRFLSGELTTQEAEKFSNQLKIPFGFLFLSSPPSSFRPQIPDLRTLNYSRPLSSNFYDVLEDCIRKQAWYKDYLIDIGSFTEIKFVGKFSHRNDSVTTVVSHMKESIGLTGQECSNFTNQDYLRKISAKFEKAGLLVIKRGMVGANTHRPLSLEEFRGFSLCDKYAPLIFINGKDAEAAQLFTLIHEAAHIWTGQSGISDQNINSDGIERFCNAIAGEFLVPQTQFRLEWSSRQKDYDYLKKIFKVSKLVIARRALDLSLIDSREYYEIQAEAYKNAPLKRSGGSGNYYAAIPVQNSRKFTHAIVQSALSGRTLLREAGRLLHINPDNIINLSKKMAEGE